MHGACFLCWTIYSRKIIIFFVWPIKKKKKKPLYIIHTIRYRIHFFIKRKYINYYKCLCIILDYKYNEETIFVFLWLSFLFLELNIFSVSKNSQICITSYTPRRRYLRGCVKAFLTKDWKKIVIYSLKKKFK